MVLASRVMAGEGPPPTTYLATRSIDVDGGPSSAMTREAASLRQFHSGRVGRQPVVNSQ
jgi:hypothetical protein